MRKFAVLLLVPALLGGWCTRNTLPTMKLRVDEGSPPDRPVFEASFGETPLLSVGEFAVARCRPHQLRSVVWQIERASPPRSQAPLRITYGQTPPGFREVVAPRPLQPGCYHALATTPGAASLAFRVLPDSIVAGGPDWQSGVFTDREIERAAVHCVRRYRRARAGADTLAVDQAVQPVADTSVACGDLRTRWPELLEESQSSERRYLEIAGSIAAIIALLAISDALDLKSR
ncbi:MAG TPA: hypothetical protein VF746_12905 [Longimicrobium sp.]|jgi:hypothetical protein